MLLPNQITSLKLHRADILTSLVTGFLRKASRNRIILWRRAGCVMKSIRHTSALISSIAVCSWTHTHHCARFCAVFRYTVFRVTS